MGGEQHADHIVARQKASIKSVERAQDKAEVAREILLKDGGGYREYDPCGETETSIEYRLVLWGSVCGLRLGLHDANR